jgi:hypothetical protein
LIIDVLALITPDPKVLGNNYLSGSTPNITYVGSPDANGLRDLVYMKGLTGGPWDWLTVGQDYIYQRMTEYKWSDFSTGKLMFGKGSPRFPRFIDYSESQPAGSWQFLVDPPKTDYVIYGPGGVPISRSSDNHVRNTFHGPHPGAMILDDKGNVLLPAGQDWVADYEWGGKLVNGVMQYGILERVFHRQGYGRYGWQSFAWRADGNYTTPTSSSQTAKIVPLPSLPILPIQRVF